MFICDQDLKDHYKNKPSFFRSVGRCEICGKQRECSEIQSSLLVSKFVKAKPALQEVNNFTDDEFVDTELAQRWRSQQTDADGVPKHRVIIDPDTMYVDAFVRMKSERDKWMVAAIACMVYIVISIIFHK